MKKIYKVFPLFLILLSVVLFPNKISALTPSESELYKNYGYVIDSYNIKMIVNENNTFDIEENITVYFNKARHGIYRYIPLRNTVRREDGTETTNRAKVTNVSVNKNYETLKENGNYVIKIGSSSYKVTGRQTYRIKYTYKLGKDPLRDKDELYYNLIGTGWSDTVIGNVSFTISMPKDFDSSKLGFSAGTYGTSGTTNVTYNVDGNTIIGEYNGILKENQALTVRLELDEGYFVVKGFEDTPFVYLLIILPILFLILSIYLWNKFGKDDLVVETVEFYPPEGFNSLDIGFLYKGMAVNNDVVSLLIYLANKGYIKIAEVEEKKILSKKKSFKIIKLREYDGTDENERKFLKGLFVNSRIVKIDEKEVEEVRESDLVDSFYTTMNSILRSKNKRSNKYKIFEKSASNKIIWVVLMIILTYLLITIPPIYAYGDIEDAIIGLIFPMVGFSVMFASIFGSSKMSGVSGSISNILSKIIGISAGLFFGLIPCLLLVLPYLLESNIYLISYIIGIICAGGMAICIRYLPKRTKYGNEMLGKLRGFKNFLETSEKEKLEAMVNDDPEYFYKILPYTYVLGVSDKWIKKFESIAIEAPSWYDSPDAFDVIMFNSFVNSTMTSAKSAMTSTPSSDSSGGGFSGGGFSGGGSGGGGGGSW